MNKKDIDSLKKEAQEELKKAKTLKDLDVVYKKYLAKKKGKLTKILRSLKDLPQDKKERVGKEANQVKDFLIKKIKEKEKSLEKEVKTGEKIDITIPAKKEEMGHLHPLTHLQRKTEAVFKELGFSIIEGPEVETEYYNFDALNIPEEHPARDLWDTFWVKSAPNYELEPNDKDKKLLLRTHTSPVQIRYMENNNPPLRIIVPGRCFRHERTDASHDIQFYQVEGLMVNKKVNAANFKAVIQEFFNRFFEKDVDLRLRPSYFPFTEPSFEVDLKSDQEWVEIMGAGMVHPKVFEAAGYNPKQWQGFAFGLGLDRLAMMKYNIDDIRLLYKNDLRFLEQF